MEFYSPRGRHKQMNKCKSCQIAETVFGGSQECRQSERERAVECGPASLLVICLRQALAEDTGSHDPGTLSQEALDSAKV